jgi:hypothetical protein
MPELDEHPAQEPNGKPEAAVGYMLRVSIPFAQGARWWRRLVRSAPVAATASGVGAACFAVGRGSGAGPNRGPGSAIVQHAPDR